MRIEEHDHPLYRKYGPKALVWKIRLQMLIGFAIPPLLFANLALHFFSDPTLVPVLGFLAAEHPLQIVGYALGVSAGVELAYMLYTPGPDEAIEPLILGLAGAVLLLVSETNGARFGIAFSVLVFTGGIGFLFWVRQEFVLRKKVLPTQPDAPADSRAFASLRQEGG